jgi:hypothetical protein
MRAPAVRRRHSQGLTDDGGRPTRHFRGARGRRFGLQAPAPRAVTPKSGCSRCRVVRRAPSLALRDDGHRSKSDDTFHGVRCLSTKSAQRIVGAPTYLTGAFRSQGFSPSQRLDPLWTSWLCFTPHPSPGFRPPELFPLDQPASPLGARCSLAVQEPDRGTGPRSGHPHASDLRLQSLDPVEHPSPVGPKPSGPLLSWPFSPSRLAGHDCWTEVRPSRASL